MSTTNVQPLTHIEAGTRILFGGNRVLEVPADIAERFRPGDSLVVVEETTELLHIPADESAVARRSVDDATRAFEDLRAADDAAIDAFYEGFASRLESENVWKDISAVNAEDVERATRRGRSTTRLVATEKMRRNMVDGLRGWTQATTRRGQIMEVVDHDGWRAELVGAPLGVVGFVFEGRPNVLADATGVLRGGNAVVFRIGSDALETARAIMTHALRPALTEAGLPAGAVSLVESSAHAAGWALFSDRRLALAVARGSGPAVATLGALAQQAGVPVSLHGTGGAWLAAGPDARPDALADAVYRSLDRKVCNTLNTCCIPRSRAPELVPAFLAALSRAASRLETEFKLHVVEGAEGFVDAALFDRMVPISRATGIEQERQAEPLPESDLGREWEWEQSPEVTLVVTEDTAHAVALFNRHSPQFVACLVSDDPDEHRRFFESVNAPFVGDGFTRWVDGQYALGKPELGLSNWQWGRLFGRGGVLSGDTVFTIRTRVVGTGI